MTGHTPSTRLLCGHCSACRGLILRPPRECQIANEDRLQTPSPLPHHRRCEPRIPISIRHRYSFRESTCRNRRPRWRRPRASAASSATRASTTRTASRDGPARLRRLPRRQPAHRRPEARPTSGPDFPRPGERRPTRSGPTRC